MRNYIAVFLVFAGIQLGSAQHKAEITAMEPADFQKEILEEGALLIDVRTPEEFSDGKIKGAKNIDFLSEDFVENIKHYNKEKPVFIYCRSGNRSGKAAKIMANMGFSKIIDLKGGFLAWKEFIAKK
ncbi:MAG TPA: rhodanese-like domain-containing protein [Salinimicrobium sp.]|nr:rhodanese-like domain-containing protein [Salinimicrobium sp.]